ncbi:MAG: OprO/OprP family phosphate-selective porin [Rickettsiales bacterium]|jgi:phosphate-selective porin|nr:OprO/OprP family phosphate-selective porin [Rickettsiales bacterium]
MKVIESVWIALLSLPVCFFSVEATSSVEREQQRESYNNVKFFGRFHMAFPVGGTAYDTRSGELDIADLNLGAYATITNNVSLFVRLTAKRHSGQLTAANVFLNIKAVDKLIFSLGQMKSRFSMDDSITADHSLFDDHRISVSQWEGFLSSGIGLMGKYVAENFGLLVGRFGNSISDDPSTTEKETISQRYYLNPYRDSDKILHLGINRIHFRDHKSSNLLDRFGLEFAVNYSVLNLQIEKKYRNFLESNMLSFLSRNFFSSDAKKNMEKNREVVKYNESFYIQLNISLTGESLEYKNGLFESINVRRPFGKSNGFGAFSLAFRFVEYDLWMPKREYREYAVGLNWIPTNNMRFSLQYSYLDNELNAAAKANGGSGKGNLVSLKWKLFF